MSSYFIFWWLKCLLCVADVRMPLVPQPELGHDVDLPIVEVLSLTQAELSAYQLDYDEIQEMVNRPCTGCEPGEDSVKSQMVHASVTAMELEPSQVIGFITEQIVASTQAPITESMRTKLINALPLLKYNKPFSKGDEIIEIESGPGGIRSLEKFLLSRRNACDGHVDVVLAQFSYRTQLTSNWGWTAHLDDDKIDHWLTYKLYKAIRPHILSSSKCGSFLAHQKSPKVLLEPSAVGIESKGKHLVYPLVAGLLALVVLKVGLYRRVLMIRCAFRGDDNHCGPNYGTVPSANQPTSQPTAPQEFSLSKRSDEEENDSSDVSSNASWISVPSWRSSCNGSECSSSDWTRLQNTERCFLADTWFETPDHKAIRAAAIKKHAKVLAADGTEVLVHSISFYPEHVDALQECDVVFLRTANATLTVTASHRIMVRKGNRAQTIRADALRPGDDVCTGENGDTIAVQELSDVHFTKKSVRVAEIVFSPDKPVAAFLTSSAILSKGAGRPKVRRTQKPSEIRQPFDFPDTDSDQGKYEHAKLE